MNGNSTRQINNAIEILFTEGGVLIEDHASTSFEQRHNKKRINRHLFDRVLKRLYYEHRGIDIAVNASKLTITLKK